jgi:hypothetical protein
MPARDLTADDIADWLTPSQAIEILYAEFKDYSLCIRTLLGRLRGGMVQAVSGHTLIQRAGTDSRKSFYAIPSDHWNNVETNSAGWTTGDFAYEFREHGRSSYLTAQHYGVRFEPQGVHAIVFGSATSASPAGRQVPIEPAPKPEPEPEGIPVSDAHLQAWFEFYKKVYNEAEDTEERALESARMNFQGKSVSRERVRALRGSQRRGPKKKTNNREI